MAFIAPWNPVKQWHPAPPPHLTESPCFLRCAANNLKRFLKAHVYIVSNYLARSLCRPRYMQLEETMVLRPLCRVARPDSRAVGMTRLSGESFGIFPHLFPCELCPWLGLTDWCGRRGRDYEVHPKGLCSCSASLRIQQQRQQIRCCLCKLSVIYGFHNGHLLGAADSNCLLFVNEARPFGLTCCSQQVSSLRSHSLYLLRRLEKGG